MKGERILHLSEMLRIHFHRIRKQILININQQIFQSILFSWHGEEQQLQVQESRQNATF